MEQDSGAKIAIRGKGSVKEGKGRSDAAHSSNQEEDLHCLIMADTEEKINKAKKLIHNVIETVSGAHPRHLPIRRPRTNSAVLGCLHSRGPERAEEEPASRAGGSERYAARR